jgi:hypothetical protein
VSVNIKRGFNRIYIVLAALWALYCAVLFPLQRQAEAIRQLDREIPVCSEYGEKDPACLGVEGKLEHEYGAVAVSEILLVGLGIPADSRLCAPTRCVRLLSRSGRNHCLGLERIPRSLAVAFQQSSVS